MGCSGEHVWVTSTTKNFEVFIGRCSGVKEEERGDLLVNVSDSEHSVLD